jgi:hypothetical protein
MFSWMNILLRTLSHLGAFVLWISVALLDVSRGGFKTFHEIIIIISEGEIVCWGFVPS